MVNLAGKKGEISLSGILLWLLLSGPMRAHLKRDTVKLSNSYEEWQPVEPTNLRFSPIIP